MGEMTDNFFNLLIFGGGIALIVCGITIAKPNLHGLNFVEGSCSITKATTINKWDDLPTCSCGKNCNEAYPCVNVYATFESWVDNMTFISGTLHNDYNALSKKCLVIPDCSSDFDTNRVGVYDYYVEEIMVRVGYDTRYPTYTGWGEVSWAHNITSPDVSYNNTPTFDCWGYDNFMYFDHSYNALNAYLALGIPSGCMVLGIFFSAVAGSSDQRRFIFKEVLSLPIMIIAGLVMVVVEIFGCSRCKLPSCNCFKRRREARAAEARATRRVQRSSLGIRIEERARSLSYSSHSGDNENMAQLSGGFFTQGNRRDTMDMAIEMSLQPQYQPGQFPDRKSVV